MSPSSHATRADGPPRRAWLGVAAFALTLLALRLLAAGYGMFIENDETSLAAGVATLLRDSDGPLYRYGPQAGYYQLVAALTRLAGGEILAIPLVQVTLSALAGTVVPLLGLAAFRGELSRQERWIVAAVLAASPILWMASRYGNSALAALPLAVGALVILSNRPARTGELVALGLMAAAILVRADAVLATPGLAVLLWRNHGGLRPAVLRFAGFGLVVAAIYALLFATDPRMHSLAQDVGDHLATPFETLFWEYLLWSVSPLPLIFAVLGLREMLPERPWLLAVLAAWTLPVLAFYFPATTQPRYFLLPSFALAIATAVGVTSVVRAAGRHRRLALAGSLGLCGLHLLVGLGHFGTNERRGFLTAASLETQTGPLWTGALLYKSYWAPGLANAPIWRPRFGDQNPVERSIAHALGALGSGAYRDRHVVLLFAPGYANVMHFYAQAAGVTIVARGTGQLFQAEFAMTHGGARLTTIGLRPLAADTAARLPVAAGDAVWIFARDGAEEATYASRLPPGLALVAGDPWPEAPRITRLQVVPIP